MDPAIFPPQPLRSDVSMGDSLSIDAQVGERRFEASWEQQREGIPPRSEWFAHPAILYARRVSSLAALLSTLKEARSERVFFAPGEVGQALDGNTTRPLNGGPIAASELLAAANEILSLDEVRDLPSTRPRIVRYEFDGEDYVIEVARRGSGVAIGARLAKSTLRRDIASEPGREPRMASVRQAAEPAPLEPAPPPPLLTPAEMPSVTDRTPAVTAPAMAAVAPPLDEPARRASRRFRAPREKHTIRVELDDEGNPIDGTAVELDGKFDAKADAKRPADPARPTRRLSKPIKRPSSATATPGSRSYETRIVARAGEPATNTEIAGSPNGAYVTFLFAPAGFSIVIEGEGAVVISKTDDAAVRGELYIGPSMKLRIAQGAKESVVTFYRRNSK